MGIFFYSERKAIEYRGIFKERLKEREERNDGLGDEEKFEDNSFQSLRTMTERAL